MHPDYQQVLSWLTKANRIQSYESILRERIDSSIIPEYYEQSGVLYRRFHSPEGAMHLPIKLSEDERHKYKLQFQARQVEKLIQEYRYTSVVELGCGSGFNSIYLAKQFPDVQFSAFDITEANLEVGRKMAAGLNNIQFSIFNFNDTHRYKVDLVFAVETLCYSEDLVTLFRQIFSCLLPGGRFVIFDGYELPAAQRAVLTEAEQKAYTLLCWGFALKKFQAVDEVYTAVQENNLHIETESDFSAGILPSYKTFQRASVKILRLPLLTKLLLATRIIPKAAFKQALSGLFGAYMVERTYMGYYQFVVKRKD